jgi:hypothetical protein
MTLHSAATSKVVGVIFALFAHDLYAKIAGINLPELVRQSSTIVLGRVQTSDSAQAAGQWAPFRSLQVFKGDAALAGRTIQLCNSPPPLGEYPKLSLLTYDVILFLVAGKSGCFEFSYRTRSVVEVHGDKVMTAALADQPLEQSRDEFIERLRKLVAEKTRTSK